MNSSERVLIWVRGASERRITIDLIAREGLEGIGCETIEQLCTLASEGAGLALIAEEMLDAAAVARLGKCFEQQPPWSDLPVVCFSSEHRRATSDPLRQLGNVTFLERPVHVRSMLAAVQSALRSRRRQFEGRKAIESRDAFLAMLGHELRNPLAAISLASTLATQQQGPVASVPELDVIRRQSQHLAHLVDELLDVARFTHGKVTLKRTPVDPLEAAHAAFEALRTRALGKHQHYEIRVADDLNCRVEGDTQRLQQVFSNLLNNAVKYTPNSGSVYLELRTEAGFLVAEVRDSGVGLTPELIGRVFDPFLQADSSLDRSEGGLGLGLSLVKSIVELHSGSVEAESAGPNQGSTFRIRLPLAERASPDAASESVSPSERPSRARQVLVVEDNDDIRELFTALLTRAGHRVVSADDGPRGLSQLLSEPPDVAFVDIGLPGFDGLELARRAREQGSKVFLIALTGYGQAEDRKRTAAVGFDEHLVKPVAETDVQRVLAEAALRARESRPRLAHSAGSL